MTMENEALERPVITEFMGDGFTLNKAHKQYLENIELWNYVQALDAYCDSLESKLREGQPVADTGSGLHLADVTKSCKAIELTYDEAKHVNLVIRDKEDVDGELIGYLLEVLLKIEQQFPDIKS